MNDAHLDQFVASTLSDKIPTELSQWIVSESEEEAFKRLCVYQSAFYQRQIDALLACYPSYAAVAGERVYRLSLRYLKDFPSCSPQLERIGMDLPEFLKIFEKEKELLNAAQLDIAKMNALLSPPPLPSLDIRSLKLDDLLSRSFEFQPGLQICEAPPSLLLLGFPETEEEKLSSVHGVACFRPVHAVLHWWLQKPELLALKAMLSGQNMASALGIFLENYEALPADLAGAEPDSPQAAAKAAQAGFEMIRKWFNAAWITQVI